MRIGTDAKNRVIKRAVSWLSTGLLCLAFITIGGAGTSWAANTCHYPLTTASGTDCSGNTFAWPGSSDWRAISSSTDASGDITGTYPTNSELDFVGNDSCPGLYSYIGNPGGDTYMYYRMRVNYPGTVTSGGSGTFGGSIFLLLRKTAPTAGSLRPEYAFSWDAKSNGLSSHGLEMQVLA